MTGRLSVAAFIAAAVILIWIEYHRRRAEHLRPRYRPGTLHRHDHHPPTTTKRIDQG